MKSWIATGLALATLLIAAAISRTGPDVREDFAARAAAVDATSADAVYRLALWARHAGLVPESRETFSRVLRLSPDHAGSRKALGYELIDGLWLRGDAAMRAKGFVRRGSEWVLEEELEAGSERIRAEETLATKSMIALASPSSNTRRLAMQTLGEVPVERLLRPCLKILERGPEPARLYATKTLREEGSEESLTALVRASIMDISPTVRTAATQAVLASGHPDAVYPYLRAVSSAYAPVRMNAARALGEIRDVRGIEVIIRRLNAVHGGGPRSHLTTVRQMSYVRDFDVEIAQAAQIGDPIIGTLQEGVVLDVRVLNVEENITTVERRLLYRTLARITGEELGEDTKAWVSWWKTNRERVLNEK